VLQGAAAAASGKARQPVGGSCPLPQVTERHHCCRGVCPALSRPASQPSQLTAPSTTTQLDETTLEEVMLDPSVRSIGADCIIELPTENDAAPSAIQEGPTWGIDRIDSRVGLDNQYDDSGITGSGAIVYVLDTGVRITHSEFGGRAEPGWSSGCNDNGNRDGRWGSTAAPSPSPAPPFSPYRMQRGVGAGRCRHGRKHLSLARNALRFDRGRHRAWRGQTGDHRDRTGSLVRRRGLHLWR